MNDFERVCQEIKYKLEKGKICSYFIVEDFSKFYKMIEIIDKKGETAWFYFDKVTGASDL